MPHTKALLAELFVRHSARCKDTHCELSLSVESQTSQVAIAVIAVGDKAVPAVTISDKAFRADQLYFSKTVADCKWLYATQHMLQQLKDC